MAPLFPEEIVGNKWTSEGLFGVQQSQLSLVKTKCCAGQTAFHMNLLLLPWHPKTGIIVKQFNTFVEMEI